MALTKTVVLNHKYQMDGAYQPDTDSDEVDLYSTPQRPQRICQAMNMVASDMHFVRRYMRSMQAKQVVVEVFSLFAVPFVSLFPDLLCLVELGTILDVVEDNVL